MKTSIKMLLTILVISMLGVRLHAQTKATVTGIYLTEQDFKAGKLSYVLNEGDKLQLNGFLNGKHVSLIYQGKKIKLSKNEIFGYRQHNQDFRFYQTGVYRILDTAGFTLYSHPELIQQGKGYAAVQHYFYSMDSAKPILNLTIQNICNSFMAQSDFRYNVENYFHQDADLITFDKADNEYEVKYLYFEHKHISMAQHASL
ncbi:hypothetical protein [Mucilaginibacter sp. SP1R1]|uniref:hypothetical protein n=1 Tax=Mucilaginibacter sp. SP1R1 TaxID=2723091 RepID=UPI0016105443|nr:hypothetical protein [Mucilaginibacter sp. SP1R1]MBB6149354.1 hypothetical protein [Mucilaginibacter sp. SP1R1]